MTRLSLAARNYLAQDPALRAHLGRSASWDTWIFDEDPVNVHVENTQRCLIVVSEGQPWSAPNGHNTIEFPTLTVDIWADPTRNSDLSVRLFDAKTKIENIKRLVDRHFHLVDPATSTGMPYIWGTAEQIANKTGVVVTQSKRRSGPDYSPVRDSEGSWMGRLIYEVSVP